MNTTKKPLAYTDNLEQLKQCKNVSEAWIVLDNYFQTTWSYEKVEWDGMDSDIQMTVARHFLNTAKGIK